MNHAELAQRLEQLHLAASAQRWPEVERGMQELEEARCRPFARAVRRMAMDLQAEMQALQLDSRLARVAAEIPDARSRLDAVIQLTEDAATQTLDLVEDSRSYVVRLQELAEQDADWREVGEVAAALRRNLTDLSAAQAYQDLSGQIIRRVIGLVGSMEQTLTELMELAGIEPVEAPAAAEGELMGPVAGRADKHKAASQADADDLLSDLGL